jgi:hypothetical protein
MKWIAVGAAAAADRTARSRTDRARHVHVGQMCRRRRTSSIASLSPGSTAPSGEVCKRRVDDRWVVDGGHAGGVLGPQTAARGPLSGGEPRTSGTGRTPRLDHRRHEAAQPSGVFDGLRSVTNTENIDRPFFGCEFSRDGSSHATTARCWAAGVVLRAVDRPAAERAALRSSGIGARVAR